MPIFKNSLSIITMIFMMISGLILPVQARQPQEAPTCGGQDIMASIAVDKPDVYAELKKTEIKSELNGPLFWKIEKDGIAPSYLFGTMHSTDKRIVAGLDQLKPIFSSIKNVAVEIADLNPAEISKLFKEHPEIIMAQQNQKASSFLSKEQIHTLQGAMKSAGLPPQVMDVFQPWYLNVSLFAVPGCERMRVASGLSMLDDAIVKYAKAQNVPVHSLETPIEQFGAMSKLSLDTQKTMLIDSIAARKYQNDLYETIIQLYAKGQIGQMIPISIAIAPNPEKSNQSWLAFKDALLDKRNKHMADRSQALLEKGGALIAVGAMHLNGAEGIVTILKNKGYKLTPIN